MKRVYCPMIEKAALDRTDEIADVWLKANICGQAFIPADYWHQMAEPVKRMLPSADIFTYSENGRIAGFIGIADGKYIAGLFVLPERQSDGIGRQLIEFCQNKYGLLELDVYVKNRRSVRFYLKNGFRICSKKLQEETQEQEYRMIWKKG